MARNLQNLKFVKVTDNNGHKIANLWRRGKTYDGQLAVVDDPNTGRRKTTKKSLVASNLSEAKKGLFRDFLVIFHCSE